MADLATAATYFNADLILLSTALSTQLKATRATIEALRGLTDLDVKILVGGVALTDAPGLWQRLGADGQADDIKTVVDLGCRLVGLDGGPAS